MTPSASTVGGGYSTAWPLILARAGIGFCRRLPCRNLLVGASRYPPSVNYQLLQAQAEEDGRLCVVAGLIVDGSGRAFVHRRSWSRAFLPGGWDVAGGHVDPGETLLELPSWMGQQRSRS